MKLGISSACYFTKKMNEDALARIKEQGVDCVELFFASRCEYVAPYFDAIAASAKGLEVWSIHAMTTQFEPELFSSHPRARQDAMKDFDAVLKAGQALGAKHYTFHGLLRLKRKPYVFNYDAIGARFCEMTEQARSHGITICYENVHYGFNSTPDFFAEIKKRCPDLGATFDIKQAMQAGIDCREFLKTLAPSLRTVHVCDVRSDGSTCLPGRGDVNFRSLFSLLRDYGFEGRVMLEAYPNDYEDDRELYDSFAFLQSEMSG